MTWSSTTLLPHPSTPSLPLLLRPAATPTVGTTISTAVPPPPSPKTTRHSRKVSIPLRILLNILTRAGPPSFAGRTIPNISRSRALLTLANLDTRRAVTTVTDGFHLERSANAEAWVAQHVGEEITSPCTRCSNGHGPFPGQACVVVDGFFGGSCASCRYNSSSARCSFRKVGSTRKSVKVAAGAPSAPQKAKSPLVFYGGVLTSTGPPTTTRTVTRARTRTRAMTTPRQLSQTVSRGRTMSPARVRSASPKPRELSLRRHFRELPANPSRRCTSGICVSHGCRTQIASSSAVADMKWLSLPSLRWRWKRQRGGRGI